MIRDLLAEMVPNADQASPEFRAVVGRTPGGAIACSYPTTTPGPPDPPGREPAQRGAISSGVGSVPQTATDSTGRGVA
jgi:hypothetical protein